MDKIAFYWTVLYYFQIGEHPWLTKDDLKKLKAIAENLVEFEREHGVIQLGLFDKLVN